MLTLCFAKDCGDIVMPAPDEWVGKPLNQIAVRRFLQESGHTTERDFLTILVWRTPSDKEVNLRTDDRLFACRNLRNIYNCDRQVATPVPDCH